MLVVRPGSGSICLNSSLPHLDYRLMQPIAEKHANLPFKFVFVILPFQLSLCCKEIPAVPSRLGKPKEVLMQILFRPGLSPSNCLLLKYEQSYGGRKKARVTESIYTIKIIKKKCFLLLNVIWYGNSTCHTVMELHLATDNLYFVGKS